MRPGDTAARWDASSTIVTVAANFSRKGCSGDGEVLRKDGLKLCSWAERHMLMLIPITAESTQTHERILCLQSETPARAQHPQSKHGWFHFIMWHSPPLLSSVCLCAFKHVIISVLFLQMFTGMSCVKMTSYRFCSLTSFTLRWGADKNSVMVTNYSNRRNANVFTWFIVNILWVLSLYTWNWTFLSQHICPTVTLLSHELILKWCHYI